MTVGLLAVVVYLYTVVAFNFFRKFYNKSEDGDLPDMKCDDMLTVSIRSVLCNESVRNSLNGAEPEPEEPEGPRTSTEHLQLKVSHHSSLHNTVNRHKHPVSPCF